MRILRAAHLGMCFGVCDALALADAGPLTILGDLVHNPTVLGAHEAKGVAAAQDVAHVTTPTLMVTAHGASERTLARTRALGLTGERQSAAVEMARHADVVVVVGGRSSNNTRELVQSCARYCARVHHVLRGVRPEWFDAATVVGLTAGTSTPDEVIDRVEARIRLRADASAGQVRQAGAPAARTLRGGVEVEARTPGVAGGAEELRCCRMAVTRSCGCCRRRSTGRCSGWPCC